MAQYYWTAADYAVGSVTPNTDGTLGESNTTNPATLVIDEIIDDGANGRAWHTDSGSDTPKYWRYLPAGESSIVEVYATWRGAGFYPTARIGFRNINGYGYTLHFGASRDGSTSIVKHNGWPDSNGTSIWSLGSGTSTSKHHVRLRYEAGVIYFKWWLDGDPEPSSWNAQVADNTYSPPFWAIIGEHRRESYWYDWGIGTGGDPAPTSAGGGQTISESIGLGIAAGVSPSATASAIDAVSLSKAFGAFLTAKAIVQESISVATSTDILDSSSATANETLTLGIALSLIAQETAGFLVTESIVLGMAAQDRAEATATAKATLALSESLGLSLSEKATATDAVLLAARAAIAASSRATVTGILTIASSYALNAYYGNIISEAIGLAHRAGLNVSAASTARADVTIALAASLVNAARALAEAGVGVGSVIDITIGESAAAVRVELPSGRTLYVRADPRTYYIRKQDRTDRVK